MSLIAALLLLLISISGGAQAGSFAQFDRDGDGTLSDAERQEARTFARAIAGGRRPPAPSGPIAPRMPELQTDLRASAAAAPRSVVGLYDESTLRTLYLRFPTADWFAELGDFYGTEIDVPADLVVDGKLYAGVGVRFRGNSSYQMSGESLKKSFNISVDHRDGGLRLFGYRTLNLLNAATDPSFVREVLYNRIARTWLPAMKANFVKLVINGESWGVYVNVQQFNSDFVKEWFGSTDGNRWKVPAGGGGGRGGFGGGAGLAYLGDEPDRYRASYELKSADRVEAWRDLARLTRVLAETPDDRLEADLAPLLDVDGALWFLAMENVFIDGDGYLSRGSDFSLFQDAAGRFHLVPYDSNETFRWAGGGGPNNWGAIGSQPGPLVHADNASRPLARRLLSLPSTRARYLAHVLTIVEEWLDW
ncbi:MAG TPA: CotH kinase family protein, partial [Desulfobacterales bacterium]|nr:CotH kinase family protein [Desulfobacterales bacterium]